MINCQNYLDAKIEKLYKHFTTNNISGIVLGISGGCDSAVTLGILKAFQDKHPDVLQIIQPIIAPIHNSIGTTEQLEAQGLAELVCQHFGISGILLQASNMSIACKTILNTSHPVVIQQVDYWLRPTLFYGVATSLSLNYPSIGHVILCGTCNKSEWLSGYFSSYLDILAINPIIDLWKSEIYQLAEYFDIPKEITNTPPKGGIANGNTDEEELGFTYDELENHFTNGSGTFFNALVEKRYQDSKFKRMKFNSEWINQLSKGT